MLSLGIARGASCDLPFWKVVSSSLVLVLASISAPLVVRAGEVQSLKRPIAVIYNGKGACVEGCAASLARVVRSVGMEIRYVTEKSLDEDSLEDAVLYVQPGGDAIEVAKVLQPRQLAAIRGFLTAGGSYLGICAGAFLADTFVDDSSSVLGLGILPGETLDFHPERPPGTPAPKWQDAILKTFWAPGLINGIEGERYLYFSEGAGFKNLSTRDTSLQILSWYEDGTPGAVRFSYGLGKVALAGMHPEAPKTWWEADGVRPHRLTDPDGVDHFIARELVRWLTR